MHDEWIFVGGYTPESGGTAEGVSLLRRDPATGLLSSLGVAARTPSPSFLAQHPQLPVLYAVNELAEGAVSAWAVGEQGDLTPLAVQSTGGREPCHLAVSPDGRQLLVANYGSGSVAVLPLDATGVPGERTDLVDLVGHGPDPDRQEGPHAHMVSPDPRSGPVLVADLGTDRLVRFRVDPTGRLVGLTPAVDTPPRTGPRHLLRHPDGTLLLVGELSAMLSWYRPSPVDGQWTLLDAVRTSAGEPPVYPSEIVTGPDGRFVYVANRGPDTVTVFGWDGTAASVVTEVPTGGVWPRHITLLGHHLYVANERSHNVTVFQVDPETGVPTAAGEPTRQPSPTCLLRWRPTIAPSPV